MFILDKLNLLIITMKEALFICIVMLIVSCSSSGSNSSEPADTISTLSIENNLADSNNSNWNNSVKILAVTQMNIKDSILLVKFFNNNVFYWDNKSSSIVHDTLYQNIVETFAENKMTYAALISDTTVLPARICSYDKNLVLGDLVFILINEIENVPFSEVFETEWDVHTFGCKYPLAMIESFHIRREMMRRQVESYLASQE